MDICDFLRSDTLSDQLVTNIVIYTEVAFFFKRLNLSDRLLILSIISIFTLDRRFLSLMRNAQVTENDLREPVLSRFSVDTGNILNTAVKFGIGIILKGRINQTRIKTELSSVACDLQHIVNRRINIAGIDSIGSVGKLLNKLLLERSSINLNHLIITVRHIKFQRISGTNVSDLFEHGHKLRQAGVVCNACALFETVTRWL